MKKILYILVGLGLAVAGTVYAAPGVNIFRNIQPETDSLFYNGTTTKAWLGVVSDEFCLTGDSCIQQWPAGGGGGGASTTIAGLSPANGVFIFATSSSGTVFTFSTSSPRTITFTFPASPTFTNLTYTGQGSFGLASGTSASLSGNLWVTGQTSLGNASSTALTVSGLSRFASTTVTGTLNVSGKVGVGTTTPQSELEVVGNVQAQQLVLQGEADIDIFFRGADGADDFSILTDGTNLTIKDESSARNIIAYARSTNIVDSSNIGTWQFTNIVAANSSTTGFTADGFSVMATTTMARLTVTGQSTLANASGTALTLSDNLWVTGNTALTGTLNVTGKTTLANASTTNLSVATNAYLTNIASGNCLQTGAGGLITSAGAACGSGGSGNSAWTIGNALIYNATTTDNVLIGTTTPTTSKLFVQGSGTQLPLRVASSTGTTLFTVDTFGSTTIANLTAGLVRATSAGSLYVDGVTYLSSIGSGSTGYVARWNGANTLAQGALIDNGTVAGINATSSSADFNIKGSGTNDMLRIQRFTGSLAQVTVDAAGNVGIGTNTPTKLLDVVGSTAGGVTRITRDVLANPTLAGNTTLYGTSDFQMLTSTSTINFPDKVGPGITFTIATGTSNNVLNMQNTIGAIGAVRDNNNTSGDLVFYTYLSSAVYNPLSLQGTTTGASVLMTGTASSTGNILNVTSSTSTSILSVTPTSRVGINTSSPTATFHVQGIASAPTLNVLNISSSTGTALLTVAGNGSTTLSSLASAGCVAATSGGSLYITSCGSGGSPGGSGGQVQYNNGGAFAGSAALLTNGTVSGVNATSSTTSFLVQGTSNLIPFKVASSTGTAMMTVSADGDVTLNRTNSGYTQTQFVISSALAGGTVFSIDAYGALSGSSGAYTINGSALKLNSNGGTALLTNYNNSNNSNLQIFTGYGFSGLNANQYLQLGYSGSGSVINSYILNGVGKTTIGTVAPTPGTSTVTTPSLLVEDTSGNSVAPIFAVASSTNTIILQVNYDGKVGINTSTPVADFQATNQTSSATTTIEFGRGGQGKGTCMKIYDPAGVAWYVSVSVTGTLSASASTCKTGF